MNWSGPSGLAGASGNTPRRGAVSPRVRSNGLAALPLEKHIRGMLAADAHGLVNVYGEAGSGKSIALEHLAAVLPGDAPVTLVDRNSHKQLECPEGQLVVFTTPTRTFSLKLLAAFEMAPWTEDDCLEYLAATHRGRCAAVLERLRQSSQTQFLSGLPELWSIVLDVMAADDSIADIPEALRWQLNLELPDQEDRRKAAEACLGKFLPRFCCVHWFNARLDRLLQHRIARLPLAGEAIVRRLSQGGGEDVAVCRLPPDLLKETARQAAKLHAAEQRLRALAESKDKSYHSTATSILHQIYPGWRPSGANVPNLDYATLPGARWEHLKLPAIHLMDADLSKANLQETVLDRAKAQGAILSEAQMYMTSIYAADLRDADLHGAQMTRIKAAWCDFANADLRNADLTEADLHDATFVETRLRYANLLRADLHNATIERCDIEGAVLRYANLYNAKLVGVRFHEVDCIGAQFNNALFDHCELESIELPGGQFERAILKHCLLTDSFMPGANFRGAKLRGAGLAGIEWPGANLHNADLSGASFHLGSSRSGLVGSVIPCEGSKTGFYTDEFTEQHYKRPEEIRKANLCNADLRGAKLDGVDFYLVDLRGARMDKAQRRHVARCGAILSGTCD
jgi:uncharacterized protein YjbI with pentapeptide repeats